MCQEIAHAVGRGRPRKFVKAQPHSARVVQLPGLGRIPYHVVVAVHREVLVVGNGQLKLGVVYVAHLHNLLASKQVCADADSRRRQVDVGVSNDCQTLGLQIFKGLYVDRLRLVGVGEAAAVLVAQVLKGVGIATQHLVKGIGRTEVFYVPGAGFLGQLDLVSAATLQFRLGLSLGVESVHGRRTVRRSASALRGPRGAVNSDVGEGNCPSLLKITDHGTQGVPSVLALQIVQGLGHFNVGIVGIEHWGFPILCLGYEYRQAQPTAGRKKAMQIKVGLKVVVHGAELVALVGRHVKGSKARG